MEFQNFLQTGKPRSCEWHKALHHTCVKSVGQFELFFPASLLIIFHFLYCILRPCCIDFSSLYHLLHPALLVLVPSLCSHPTHDIFLFHCFPASFSFLRSSPFLHRLDFCFPCFQMKQTFLLRSSTILLLLIAQLAKWSWYAAAYSCTRGQTFYSLTLDCAHHNRKFGEFYLLAMTIFKVIFKQLTPCTNTRRTTLS